MANHAFFSDDPGEDLAFKHDEWLAIALAAVICAVITALAMPWPV